MFGKTRKCAKLVKELLSYQKEFKRFQKSSETMTADEEAAAKIRMKEMRERMMEICKELDPDCDKPEELNLEYYDPEDDDEK